MGRRTRRETVAATEEVVANVCETFWRSIVQADNKQGLVDDVQTRSVIAVRQKTFTHAGPDFAILCRQHADGGCSNLVDWRLVCVGHDCLKVSENLALGHEKLALIVQHIEPVYVATIQSAHAVYQLSVPTELTAAKNHDMRRVL